MDNSDRARAAQMGLQAFAAEVGVGSEDAATQIRDLLTDLWHLCDRLDVDMAHEPVPCVVLDPFAGSGTTLEVAKGLSRSFIGVELNPKYAEMIKRRIDEQLWLGQKPMEVR